MSKDYSSTVLKKSKSHRYEGCPTEMVNREEVEPDYNQELNKAGAFSTMS